MPVRDRDCAQCGNRFRGAHLRCSRCRRTERNCITCAKVFLGEKAKCPQCSAFRRDCACGRSFVGTGTKCGTCRRVQRECRSCGKHFTGTNSDCGTCQGRDRECTVCGKAFRGTNLICIRCHSRERECARCGLIFYDNVRFCYYCRAKDRVCTKCGEGFFGATSACGPCRGRRIRQNAPAEELRARAAEIARRRYLATGPEPEELFKQIRASGPCVYCGADADTVDHVIPVLQGGTHDEQNLVPACKRCNASKGNRRLTRWRPDRVARAVEISPKVAAVYRAQQELELVSAR